MYPEISTALAQRFSTSRGRQDTSEPLESPQSTLKEAVTSHWDPPRALLDRAGF